MFDAFNRHDAAAMAALYADEARLSSRSSAGSEPPDLKIMTFLTVRDGRITEDDSLFDTQGRPCLP